MVFAKKKKKMKAYVASIRAKQVLTAGGSNSVANLHYFRTLNTLFSASKR